MKTKTINLYLFNELNEEQQKIVLNKYAHINLEMLTSEDLLWDFSEAGQYIADQGFLDPDIQYSCSNSQGDGLCFTCNNINWDLMLEDLEIPHKSLFTKLLQGNELLLWHWDKINYRYTHEHTHRFRLFVNYDREGHTLPKITYQLKRICLHVEHKKQEACLTAFQKLVAGIDSLCSKDSVAETLIANEYCFNEETLKIDHE